MKKLKKGLLLIFIAAIVSVFGEICGLVSTSTMFNITNELILLILDICSKSALVIFYVLFIWGIKLIRPENKNFAIAYDLVFTAIILGFGIILYNNEAIIDLSETLFEGIFLFFVCRGLSEVFKKKKNNTLANYMSKAKVIILLAYIGMAICNFWLQANTLNNEDVNFIFDLLLLPCSLIALCWPVNAFNKAIDNL